MRKLLELIKKRVTPAADDACGLCGYWRCCCSEVAR